MEHDQSSIDSETVWAFRVLGSIIAEEREDVSAGGEPSILQLAHARRILTSIIDRYDR